MTKERKQMLKLTAQDLLYYGYNFIYFYTTYCEREEKAQALEIWEKEREKMANTF